MVRAVLLKGRQTYGTTYVQARYYHRAKFHPYISAFVLAHHSESTASIFSMTRRFHQEMHPDLQDQLVKDTERAIELANGSRYSVGTAGSAQIGRGKTVHLFHGSECAFYENADQLSTGLMQTVADVPGTEMIFESTANGPAGFFYNLVNGAISGKNGFILVFIPWYWMPEYTLTPPLKESELDDVERQYYNNYKQDGLTLFHLAWRRRKIEVFEGKVWKFQQEYPFTIQEAFIKAEARFFDLAKVDASSKRIVEIDPEKSLILGIDQGRTGDSTVISRRVGKTLMPFEEIPGDDGQERDMRLAGRVAKIIDREAPDLVVFDTTNEHGALDRLHELGYSRRMVKGVHFGERANDPTRHRNKRTEMYVEFREWMADDDTSIPADQQFISEIGAIPEAKETSNQVMYLVSKDTIKADLGWSPNKLDAAVLTFAYPCRKRLTPGAARDSRQSINTTFRSTLRSKNQ